MNEMPQETVTLGQARAMLEVLASEQSVLLLSAPGVGKSEMVAAAAAQAGLPCRSLLGTQIAPEDVSGIPRIVGERSVFCPPRVLLPDPPEPVCLFLDEFPASGPDVQKALYSLLLERRLGEHELPAGTWVVAAGNRIQDRALIRSLSSALMNRVLVLHVRVDVKEWIAWARGAGVRDEIIAFIVFWPAALQRDPPMAPGPFSTPRSWTLLGRALDLADEAGLLDSGVRRALAFGRVSPDDAAVFCAVVDAGLQDLRPVEHYLLAPEDLPTNDAARWFLISRLRYLVSREEVPEVGAEALNRFLLALPQEHRFALFVGLIDQWGRLGTDDAMLASLWELVGV